MMTPRGVANLDPRGMIGRIYVEYHLHTYLLTLNIQALGLVVLEKKIFRCFPIISSPGSRLAGIVKGLTKHCFTQKYKSVGPHGFRKRFFYVFSYYKSMEANDPGAWPTWTPRGLIGRIYEGDH